MTPSQMSVIRRRNGHGAGCACERCMAPVIDFIADHSGDTLAKPIAEESPVSRDEHRAALDRAYNLGVETGRKLARGRVS